MRLPPAEEALPHVSPFHGQVVVFTGKLASVGRREARELVDRLGGIAADDVTARTTMLVVGVSGASPCSADASTPEGARSLKLRKAERVNAAAPGRVRILPEEDFCRLGGLPSVEALDRQYHSLAQILDRYPAVREDHLRYLEKWSLVHPVARTNTNRYYGFQDLRTIRQLSEGLGSGAAFRRVLRAIVAAREGQLTLDFSQRMGEAHPVKVVALRSHRESGATPATVAEVLHNVVGPAVARREVLSRRFSARRGQRRRPGARASRLSQGAAARSESRPGAGQPRQHPLRARRARRGASALRARHAPRYRVLRGLLQLG